MNIIVNLPINNDCSLVIVSEYDTSLDVMYGYSGELFAALKYGKKLERLSSKLTLWDLESFLDHFEAVLNNSIMLPQQIKGPQELGLSYNDYWYEVSSNRDKDFDEWIGTLLKLLEGNGFGLKSNVTFLYSKDRAIELVITLAYPWFFPIKKVSMLYATWLKYYKVLYHFNISKETLRDWIQILKPVCIQLRKNVDTMYSS